MKKAQLMGQPFVYLMILIVIALIFIFGFRAIGQLNDDKDLATYATFRNQLVQEVRELSLLNKGSSIRYTEDSTFKKPLIVPNSVEYICFKKAGYDASLIPEGIDKTYFELDGTVFLLPEQNDYQPFELSVDFEKNPLCIKTAGSRMAFILENKGSGIVGIR